MGLIDVLDSTVNILKNIEKNTRDERLKILEKAENYGQQTGRHLKPEYQREFDRLRELQQQRKPR